MKLHLFTLSILLTLATSTYCQPPTEEKSQDKGKLAGINAHMSRYGTYLEKNRKLLYEELSVPVEVIQSYLEPWDLEDSETLSYPIAPNKSIEFSLLEADQAEALATASSEKSLNYPIPFTYFTHRVSEGRYLVRLYDQRALLINRKEEMDALKGIQIDLLDEMKISWRMPISEKVLTSFLADSSVIQLDTVLFGDLGGEVYEVPSGAFLWKSSGDDGAIQPMLFQTLAGLFYHINAKDKMQTEAAKFLVNQLVDGETPPSAYHFLFQLSKFQVKEIGTTHNGKDRPDLVDSLHKVMELENGKLLYYHPRYGFARVFEGEATYASYQEQMAALSVLPTTLMAEKLSDLEVTLKENKGSPSHLLEEELQYILSLTSENLDYSRESLIVIDEILKWNRNRVDRESLVLPMIAYLGGIHQKMSKGSWEWVESNLLERSIPQIKGKDGKKLALPIEALLEMLEPGGEIPNFYDWITAQQGQP